MDTNNIIDWNGKLEAVHEDGRVVDVTVAEGPDWEDAYRLDVALEYGGKAQWFKSDGTQIFPLERDRRPWTIRNKPAAAVGGEFEKYGDRWGPEIAVFGERPKGLVDDSLRVYSRCSDGYEDVNKIGHLDGADGSSNWLKPGVREDGHVVAIRLPANHPHYRTEKPATGPNGVLTGTERMERLEALAQRLAAFTGNDVTIAEKPGVPVFNLSAEARALCPEPEIDPDLIKAREIMAEVYTEARRPDLAKAALGGKMDGRLRLQATIRGIKAGRELEK